MILKGNLLNEIKIITLSMHVFSCNFELKGWEITLKSILSCNGKLYFRKVGFTCFKKVILVNLLDLLESAGIMNKLEPEGASRPA